MQQRMFFLPTIDNHKLGRRLNVPTYSTQVNEDVQQNPL